LVHLRPCQRRQWEPVRRPELLQVPGSPQERLLSARALAPEQVYRRKR
jgi:hypothetical protein